MRFVFGKTFLASSRLINIVTGSIARSAKRRYLSYSEADFEVFRPTGVARCTDGSENWESSLFHAKFHPHCCNDKGIGPKTEIFTEI